MKKKAFVIDDNGLDRQILAGHLKNLSLDCLSFTCGREALDAVRCTVPNLCVVDIYMPDMDGLEVIRSLRRSGYEGLVIAVTSGGSRAHFDVLRYAEAFGADLTIKKPVNAAHLARAVTQELRAS